VVWDNGNDGSGRNTTADFLSGMVGSLPKLHELAAQAGIELPPALGRLKPTDARSEPSDVRQSELSQSEAAKPINRKDGR
jgi:flotillin